MNGNTNLARRTVSLIGKAAKENALFVSAITLWEMSMLVAKEKIILDMPVLEWILKGLRAPGINLVPLTPQIAVESCQLQGKFHGDPADRIIVATARIEELTLITRDQKILDFGESHYVNVHRG
jgi:PIN domain nuclease of toxin-antitoxin system